MAKAQDSAGSDLPELKALLKLAHSKPVNVAFGIGGDGKVVIKLDRMKQPKALAKALKDSDPKIKSLLRGQVEVDEDDSSTANFMMNKAAGGIQGKLVIALKGTGISNVNITAAEEDEPDDEAQSDDGADDADPSDATASADTQQDTDPPPDPATTPDPSTTPDPAPASAAPDAGTLTTQLTGLVKQMMGALVNNPAQKTTLIQLATSAQASLKSGDLNEAAAGMEILRQAIADANGQDPSAPASAAPPPATQADATTPPPETTPAPPQADAAPPVQEPESGGADSAGAQKFHKSRAAWSATRKKIHADLHHLRKMMKEASEDEEVDIEESFNSAIQPVLDTLSEELSDILGRAAEAEAAERERILIHARRAIASHIAFVEQNPVISHLDQNPFMKLSIAKTLSGTLMTLATIVK